MVMKIMLHMSGQDESAFDVETQTSKGLDGQDAFSRMVRILNANILIKLMEKFILTLLIFI